jgi:hypothetical protein
LQHSARYTNVEEDGFVLLEEDLINVIAKISATMEEPEGPE